MDSAIQYIENLKSRLTLTSNVLLWRLLRSYRDIRLVLHGDMPSFEFRHESEADVLYLPVRSLTLCISRVSLPAQLNEFHTVFDGLREKPFGRAGGFVPRSEIKPLREHWKQLGPDLTIHQDCPVIFTSAGGDLVVLTSDSSVCWATHEEHEVVAITPSFDDFLKKYVKHRVHDGYPFDPYGREG